MHATVRRAGATLVVVLALGLGGCGGDDDGTSHSAQKTSFIAEGERLCTEFKSRLDAIFLDFAPTLGKRVEAYGEVVPLGRDFAERFAALRPPEPDRPRIEASLQDYRRGLDQLEEGVRTAQADDLARSNGAFDAAFQSFARSDDILRSYGFTVCAEPKTTRGVGGLSEAERQTLSAERRAYIDRADAICREGNQRLKPLEDQAFARGVPDLATWRAFLTSAVPIFEDVSTRLRALTPPPGDEATISAVLADYDAALAAAHRASEAAAAGDQRAFDAAIDEATELAKRGDEQSRRYGFRDCREG
ncbi:MAG TPA: hypothetical protein VHG90_08140 [Acidimicrobiales bacterium]|nr:hypothetical protein [Acidimicrobiales bacterium]